MSHDPLVCVPLIDLEHVLQRILELDSELVSIEGYDDDRVSVTVLDGLNTSDMRAIDTLERLAQKRRLRPAGVPVAGSAVRDTPRPADAAPGPATGTRA